MISVVGPDLAASEIICKLGSRSKLSFVSNQHIQSIKSLQMLKIAFVQNFDDLQFKFYLGREFFQS
jgi:hypothetical protein